MYCSAKKCRFEHSGRTNHQEFLSFVFKLMLK
jgi:hypothetical protein